MPIATVASIVWILIWLKSEKAMNNKSTSAIIVIYAVLFIVQYLLSYFVMSPLSISSENFWLGRFDALVGPITVLSVFRRAAISPKPYPLFMLFKNIFYGIFIFGTVMVVALFLGSVISPPEFA